MYYVYVQGKQTAEAPIIVTIRRKKILLSLSIEKKKCWHHGITRGCSNSIPQVNPISSHPDERMPLPPQYIDIPDIKISRVHWVPPPPLFGRISQLFTAAPPTSKNSLKVKTSKSFLSLQKKNLPHLPTAADILSWFTDS